MDFRLRYSLLKKGRGPKPWITMAGLLMGLYSAFQLNGKQGRLQVLILR